MPRFTQREYLWLDDAVNSAQLQSKCFSDQAQKSQDPAIKDLMNNCAQMHQRHFERLARYVIDAQGQPMQQYNYQNQAQSGQTGYGYTAGQANLQSNR